MVRFALLLLALPSLLMPPGMCVCRYARIETATSTLMPAESIRVRSEEAAPRSGGCCKKCRTVPPVAGPQPDSCDHRSDSSPPSPSDRDHAPNCPAAGPTATAKIVEPPILLPDLVTVAVGGLVDLIAEPTISRETPVDSPSLAAPRYISFRALLI